MSGNILDKLDRLSSATGATLKSVARLALKSHKARIPVVGKGKTLIVMGNGPSLNDAIANHLGLLKCSDTLAVNFAANTPEFFEIKPKYYVLADPHFFRHTDNENVARLMKRLNAIDWPMTLFIPHGKATPDKMFSSPKLTVCRYNMLAVEGYRWLEDLAFKQGWGMPRPRNVLIPSIMLGLGMGYDEVLLLGADHSWLQTLSVDDDNRVVSIQKHFYQDEAQELERIRRDYVGLPLHEVVGSMATAFRAYHRINRYAERRGQRVVNATPGSMIDAFPRLKTLNSDA